MNKHIINLLQKKSEPKEITKKRQQVKEKLLEIFLINNFKNATNEQVEKTFYIFDEIYFDGYLKNYIDQYDHIHIGFKSCDKLKSSAGLCKLGYKYNQDGYFTEFNLSIFISKPIINNIFNNNEKSLAIGGLKCYDRLECFMIIFEHELIHFIINLFDFEINNKEGPHGKTFKTIIKNLFNHTNIFHNLKDGDADTNEENLKILKDKLKIGNYVITKGCNTGDKIEGTIIKIYNKTVLIKSKENKYWKIYHRFIEEIIDKKESNKKILSVDQIKKKLKKGIKIKINFNNEIVNSEIINLGSKRALVKLDDNTRWYIPYKYIIF